MAKFNFMFTVECPNCGGLFEVSHFAIEVLSDNTLLDICPGCGLQITTCLIAHGTVPPNSSAAADPLSALMGATWIKVSDRLPNPGQEVLTYWQSEGRIDLQTLESYQAVWWWRHGYQSHMLESHRITHWMALPSPPDLCEASKLAEESDLPDLHFR